MSISSATSSFDGHPWISLLVASCRLTNTPYHTSNRVLLFQCSQSCCGCCFRVVVVLLSSFPVAQSLFLSLETFHYHGSEDTLSEFFELLPRMSGVATRLFGDGSDEKNFVSLCVVFIKHHPHSRQKNRQRQRHPQQRHQQLRFLINISAKMIQTVGVRMILSI